MSKRRKNLPKAPSQPQAVQAKSKVSVFYGFAVALLVVALGATMFYSEKSTRFASASNAPAAAAPAPAPAQKAELLRMHSPMLGNQAAPVLIVEFFDPACDTCRDFYPFVKKMMAANPDRIRLAMRYAPFHKGSDRVVALLEAARRQGKFWPALEALYAGQSDWVVNHVAQPDRASKYFEGLGLNMEKLRADAQDPEVAAVIQEDLHDAFGFNVAQTPEFFVNGKPMPSFGYEQLRTLVNDALAAAPR